MSRLTLIVAATVANGIGHSSRLPWRLPQEMAYFARTTSNAPEGSINAVVMGRNTWESIPRKFRPLKERMNVVVSRNEDYQLLPSDSGTPNIPVHLHSNVESALACLSASSEKPIHRAFIIGGASLYNDTLLLSPSGPSFVDRILLTRVLSPAFEECDVFMPDFEHSEDGGSTPWKRALHSELQEWVGFEVPEGVQQENGVEYEFQMWVR